MRRNPVTLAVVYNRQHILRPLPLVFERAILIGTATSGWPDTKIYRAGEERVVLCGRERKREPKAKSSYGLMKTAHAAVALLGGVSSASAFVTPFAGAPLGK